LGKDGATCFHTLDEKRRDIKKESWEKERFGMVCSTPAVFMDWKASIEKLCRMTKKCIYKRETDSFFKKVNEVAVRTQKRKA
jgi:hypothetical protein